MAKWGEPKLTTEAKEARKLEEEQERKKRKRSSNDLNFVDRSTILLFVLCGK